jgi:hypothetical protein
MCAVLHLFIVLLNQKSHNTDPEYSDKYPILQYSKNEIKI